MQDCLNAKEFPPANKTHCPHGHEYAIYGKVSKRGWRICSFCDREQKRRRYLNAK